MCAIFGWNQRLPEEDVDHILDSCLKRGRDGWGFWADGEEYRGKGGISKRVKRALYSASRVVGNFRATPTTEAETKVKNLQPYDGIVHNGVIANDKEFGDFEIDSMVLPKILEDVTTSRTIYDFSKALQKIVGSFALAFFRDKDLFLGCNYKPIYIFRINGLVIFASQPYMIPDSRAVAMKPYSGKIFIEGYQSEMDFDLPTKQNTKVILAASAGLDSTTVAYQLKEEGYEVTLAHFKYGCNAEEHELRRVKEIAKSGGFNLAVIDMPKSVLGGTIVNGDYNKDGDGVVGAEYAKDWVSARNLLMLSLLTAYAETHGFGFIAFGGNLEESGAYPDNEEEFGNRFNALLPFAVQNGVKIDLLQPLARMMKHEIVAEGLRLKVPYELTWSCYGDGEKHCGKCGPCYMRKTAFERNGTVDPVYTV